jgi:cell division protein FtsI (penicillin-binding protein 3)
MATRTLKPTNRPVAISRWRISALLVVCALVVARVGVRLGEIQVLQHAELARSAQAEIDQQITLQPRRGQITDSAGNVLAMDVERESLWVVPQNVSAARAPQLALTLGALLGQDSGEILKKLTDRDHYWLPIARWMEPQVAAQVAALDEAGLVIQYEPRRVYPQTTFAAQIVGAVNDNGDGISGVESFYNSTVKGITGTLTAALDPHDNPIWIEPQQMRPARDGADLQLTIDPLVQHVIERELKSAVEKHEASGGTIIVMEAATGAIRGMASYPTFDPNRWQQYAQEVYSRNPAISDVYEPGSTFKIVTVAAGLQARAFTADTTVPDNGSIDLPGATEPIHNWDWNGHGATTPGDVLYYSSNVGALQLAGMMGEEGFYKYVKAFGFGQGTGIDLGGEEGGIVNEPGGPAYSGLTLPTNGFGQGIGVTPLQLVRAVGVIANNGRLMRPYVVQRRCQGGECVETQPVDEGEVVEPGVAWTVRRMLVKSANHYVNASQPDTMWLVPGYEVTAKTGTASIPDGNGGYEPYTIGSVVGFGPAEGARYVVLVKVDRPKDDIWGVGTAIPVYQAVMDQLMRYAKIPPDPAFIGPEQ